MSLAFFELYPPSANSARAEWNGQGRFLPDLCPRDRQESHLVTDDHTQLFVRLGRVGANCDVMFTWYYDLMVTPRALHAFEAASLTGFEVRPVVIADHKRSKHIKELWELWPHRPFLPISPRSGRFVVRRCEAYGCPVEVSGAYNPLRVFDAKDWDGRDMFRVETYGGILVSQRFVDTVKSADLWGFKFMQLVTE